MHGQFERQGRELVVRLHAVLGDQRVGLSVKSRPMDRRAGLSVRSRPAGRRVGTTAMRSRPAEDRKLKSKQGDVKRELGITPEGMGLGADKLHAPDKTCNLSLE